MGVLYGMAWYKILCGRSYSGTFNYYENCESRLSCNLQKASLVSYPIIYLMFTELCMRSVYCIGL